jgi:hypothetical protein
MAGTMRPMKSAMFPQLARFTDFDACCYDAYGRYVFVTSGYSHLKEPTAL